jgi:hypothetical protein
LSLEVKRKAAETGVSAFIFSTSKIQRKPRHLSLFLEQALEKIRLEVEKVEKIRKKADFLLKLLRLLRRCG